MNPANPLITLWVHSIHESRPDLLKQLKNWLANLQIQCLDISRRASYNGILMFNNESINEKDMEWLSTLIEEENEIIAIDISEKTTPYYKIWKLFNLGVLDVVSWKLGQQLVELIKSRFIRRAYIRNLLVSDRVKNTLVGSCAVWKKALNQIIETACFGNSSVLILGETGTGKELVANLIHDLDKRLDKKDLVLLDCSTIVPELFGSEFFGHEKGAFTNAVSMREGAFSLANKGTLFLDEAGELPPALQAALLRVIQEGTYKKVGSNLWQKSTFRLISATNKNLLAETESGKFRADLFFRISTSIIQLPSLKARKLDIPELASHFLAQALETNTPPSLDKPVLHYLLSRDYDGNIRELRQVVSRMAYKYPGSGPITLGCLPESARQQGIKASNSWHQNGFADAIQHALADGVCLKEIKRMAGDIALQLAIDAADGKLPEAARQLGVSDRMVQGWWKERSTE